MRALVVMPVTATVLVFVAVMLFWGGCQHPGVQPASPPPFSDALAPSPRLIVGRIVAVDADRGFAFIELATDAPAAATEPETELVSRTHDLRETARLQASRQLRGRTLGTAILAGKPGAGDEVVWVAP